MKRLSQGGGGGDGGGNFCVGISCFDFPFLLSSFFRGGGGWVLR